MPFIRLSDDYVDHPKFRNLSDGAFRLWHHMMAYCRKFQTDGLMPLVTVRGLRPYSTKRLRILMTPCDVGEQPLVEAVEGFGVKIHNYLFWNLSKEEEQTDNDAATARMRRLRKDRKEAAACSPEQVGERSPFVPEEVEEKKASRKIGKGGGGGKGLSNRPIFDGQAFVVFEWMLGEFMRTLGSHTDAFGLDEWMDALDQRTAQQGLIIPRDAMWPWLQQEFAAEIRRRGLPVVQLTNAGDEQDAMWAAIAKKGPSR